MFSLPPFPSPLLSLLTLPQFSHYHFIKTINLRQVVLSAAFGYPATCQIPCPAAPAITYIYSHIYSLFIFCLHSPVCFLFPTHQHVLKFTVPCIKLIERIHTPKYRHNIVLGGIFMINNHYARELFFCFGIRASESNSGMHTLHGIS